MFMPFGAMWVATLICLLENSGVGVCRQNVAQAAYGIVTKTVFFRMFMLPVISCGS